VNKIPTVFLRDPDNRARVTDTWHPDCLWVRDGEVVPTRKFDGTCVMFDGTRWWARRVVKQGRDVPPDFQKIDHDPITGKLVGWEPAEQSPFAKYLREVMVDEPDLGTYELCGPKINGNPEGFGRHVLIRHADAAPLSERDRTYPAIREMCLYLMSNFGIEGIVYHHPDGRMAKIKAKDFR
jgi:hypothetical protein